MVDFANLLDRYQVMVFTDLDGTLLDHESYSFEPAKPALNLLKDKNIPLVLASSKTAAEIAPLREQVGFSHCPAIVENGAGILEPHMMSGAANSRYQDIIDVLNSLPQDLRSFYKGFSNWSVEDVSQVTGLSIPAAKAAKDRHFSEPGLWSGNDEDWQTFKARLKDSGLIAQQGGRFKTLSFGGNKADRVAEFAKSAQDENADNPKPIFTIALGDAGNDIAMLEAANIGIVIKNPSHNGIPELKGDAAGTIIRTAKTGPEGWNQSILELLAVDP